MQSEEGTFVHPIRNMLTRNFILAFCAQMALMSIFQLLIPTLPLYLRKRGCTEIEVGILVGTLGMASLVSRPLVGKALVRVSAKIFMMVGAGLHVVSSIAYLVIPPFWPLLLVRVLHGGAFGLFHTTSTTYAVSITDADHRARILGYFALTMNFAGVIAPPLGVVLFNRFGSGSLFLVCTAISLGMFLASATLGRSSAAAPQSSTGDQSFLLSTRALPHSIVGFMALFVWASLITFFPLYATNQGVANPGLFFTATAIMLILSRTLAGRIMDVPNKRRVILPCIITSILAMVVLSLSRTQPMFLLSAALWGAGHAFLMPSLLALALERAGSSPSPVVATFYAVSDLGVFVGPLITGVVVHYTSYPIMFFSLSLVGVVNFLYFWWFSGRRTT
jgi:predicted MFS family arabinose efflux permease